MSSRCKKVSIYTKYIRYRLFNSIFNSILNLTFKNNKITKYSFLELNYLEK